MRKKIEEDLSLGEAVKKNYGEGKATEEKSEEENQEKTTHEVKPEEKTGGKKITHPLSEFLKCAVLFHSELSRGNIDHLHQCSCAIYPEFVLNARAGRLYKALPDIAA